jgi:hypothetical protein
MPQLTRTNDLAVVATGHSAVPVVPFMLAAGGPAVEAFRCQILQREGQPLTKPRSAAVRLLGESEASTIVAG